jgi:hypothetical protein
MDRAITRRDCNREALVIQEIAQGRADDPVIINQKNSGCRHKASHILLIPLHG